MKSLFCSCSPRDPFLFSSISNVEICIALKAIDPKKSPRSDGFETNLLKVSDDYIAEPLLIFLGRDQFLFQTE